MPHYMLEIDEDGVLKIEGVEFHNMDCVKSPELQKLFAEFRIPEPKQKHQTKLREKA